MSNKKLHDLTTQVRRDILRMVHKVNSGCSVCNPILLLKLS